MQKIILPLLFVMLFITQGKAQKRLFDQQVELKTCNISIEANSFIATTTIEMEFYNPKDQEVEGRQEFQLNRGQVITGFQLELNGKYREGSIEERWKARQAYSSIVGKRIDPALIQMSWQNQYSINIYPVPAKSSRRIKFTITQMMTAENSKLVYNLPLKFAGTTTDLSVNIKINRPASNPGANAGLIEKQLFNMNNNEATLSWQAKNIVLNQPVSFSVNQLANQPQICITQKNNKAYFLMWVNPGVPAYYASTPRTVNVYWDVSLSGANRDLVKELDFLEKYIFDNRIDKTNIILFNQQVQGTIFFDRAKDSFYPVRNFLLNYKYSGATELGNLNFTNVSSDVVLLFSDGINSVGNAEPTAGAVPVNFITSQYGYNYNQVKKIIGNTGGATINLSGATINDAVRRTDSAENFLFRYYGPHVKLNETFPIELGKSILLSGIIDQPGNLQLIYGNNSALNKTENYFLPVTENCDGESYKKIQMLKTYDSLMYGNNSYYSWQNMVIFGLTEKVVTPQTSYLVLERIEDYVKYKIAPPEELKEKCAEMNYVYKSEYKIKALKEFTEQDALESVVKDYNRRINWWNKNETLIDLNKPQAAEQNIDMASNPSADNTNISGHAAGVQTDVSATGGQLTEVVVTSAFGTKRTARSSASNVQNISLEQLNIIRESNINNALAGKVSGMQVRSQSAGKLGVETLIRLRGENGFGVGAGPVYVVDGTIIPSAGDINIDDIEDVTVLQGPAAAALFGPDGSNGAIVINSKKGRRNYGYYNYRRDEYKLSSAEDENYIKEMRQTGKNELWAGFLALEKDHKTDIGFYFDMADLFFEKRKEDKAEEILYNAIELCNGNSGGLRLAAYMFEKWKYFDKAIAIYKGLLNNGENNLMIKRDLALAYFQNKNFEEAVKTYYSIITAPEGENYKSNVKENALAEMNAVLAMHKNEFDISYINRNLLKALPVDLRITVEANNYSNVGYPQVTEPGNATCNYNNPNSVNGGRFSSISNYRYDHDLSEYSIKKATTGKYRIKVNSYDGYSYQYKIPTYVRVISFKNFQKPNMELEIKIFDLDNQYGTVELDAVIW